MARVAPTIKCRLEDQQELTRLAASRTESRQAVERARMVLGCLAGQRVQAVARQWHTRPNTVIKWRQRFVARELNGLRDAPRPGAQRVYDETFRNRVLATREQPPPSGQATWDGPAVAAVVRGSVHAVWRVWRKEGICLQRQRSWCVSTDKEFAAKAADIVGRYLDPPEKTLVICVDEKPSIQALERATGYVETDTGQIGRGFKRTYKRHGTLTLFAALPVATGHVQPATTARTRREEFLRFMDAVVAEAAATRELPVIVDHYGTHKKCDAWLAQHPNVHVQVTPTSASWLNQVEIWGGILSRNALRAPALQAWTNCGRPLRPLSPRMAPRLSRSRGASAR